MIRSTQHILKFSNKNKLKQLDDFYELYREDLQFYINLILSEKLPLKQFMSTPPINKIESSIWRQNIYKQASEIVRSNIKLKNRERYKRYKRVYNYFKKNGRQQNFIDKRFKELNLKPILKYIKKINIKNITINADQRLLNFRNGNYFDEFAGLSIPVNNKGYRKTLRLNLPIKWHSHSLKYRDWDRSKTAQLKKINNNFYIIFIYKKKNPIQKKTGKSLGIDIGYKKLISTSDGKFYGNYLLNIYNKLSRKKRNSKNYKQTLVHKKNEINRIVNQFISENQHVDTIYVEDLNSVKYKSKFSKKFNNKLQYWSYRQCLDKLEKICDEQGILMEKVSPQYTSQICSNCGQTGKRNKEKFICEFCGMETDADYNAAVNILHKGT